MGQKQSGLTPKKIACLSKETHFSQNEIITWYQGKIYIQKLAKFYTKNYLATSQPCLRFGKYRKRFYERLPDGKVIEKWIHQNLHSILSPWKPNRFRSICFQDIWQRQWWNYLLCRIHKSRIYYQSRLIRYVHRLSSYEVLVVLEKNLRFRLYSTNSQKSEKIGNLFIKTIKSKPEIAAKIISYGTIQVARNSLSHF